MKIRKIMLLAIALLVLGTLFACGEEKETSEYKVTFISNGGSLVESTTTTGSVEKPEDPYRTGFEFVGWYSDNKFSTKFDFNSNVSGNTVLYARWIANVYSIDYVVGDGATNSGLNPDVYTALQNDIRLADPTLEGKFFAGWFTDQALTQKVVVIKTNSETNYTLYAKWADEQEVVVVDYAILYNLNGGTNAESNPDSFNKNDANITLAAATKEGYTFKGWFKDAEFKNPIVSIDTSVEADYTLYAKFEETIVVPEKPTYTINYHLNGGTNGNNPVRYTEDMDDIILESPTKLSCTFQGWFTDEACTQEITTIDCSEKKAYDVYAKWFNGVTEVVYDLDLGIGKDYVFYQVSDTHVNSGNTNAERIGEDAWINSNRYSYASNFGEQYSSKNLYQSSVENYKAIVQYINGQNADAVFYSGDIMDRYSTSNYDFVDTEMPKTNAPFVYALGNHEEPSSTCDNICGIADTSFQTIEFDDLIIVCMDDTTKDDDGNWQYTESQYQKLLVEIAKEKPIIIVQHVPLLTSYNCGSRLEKCGSYYYMDENSCSETSSKVLDLLMNNQYIKLIVCGHIHGGIKTEYAPGKYQINCTSGLIGTVNRYNIH